MRSRPVLCCPIAGIREEGHICPFVVFLTGLKEHKGSKFMLFIAGGGISQVMDNCYLALDKEGVWISRSKFRACQYWDNNSLLRVYSLMESIKDEYAFLRNALLCGMAAKHRTCSL
ncbi:hypothetical protein AAC387_Pa03g1760 [Persea americana]